MDMLAGIGSNPFRDKRKRAASTTQLDKAEKPSPGGSPKKSKKQRTSKNQHIEKTLEKRHYDPKDKQPVKVGAETSLQHPPMLMYAVR